MPGQPDWHGDIGILVCLSLSQVSPDGALVAFTVDYSGDEVYTLGVRSISSSCCLLPPGQLVGCGPELIWCIDSRCLLLTRPDEGQVGVLIVHPGCGCGLCV